MCDRISIILGGKIIARGTVAELRAQAGGEDEHLTPVFLKLTGRRRPSRRSTRACDHPGRPSLPLAPDPRLPGQCGTARRRREKGDGLRLAVFAGLGLFVAAALFAIVFWLSWQLDQYEELGDYLVRLGLSWLFLTFLSFVAFSALVTSLTTFFLSEDLRLLLAAPLDADRLFHSRFAKAAAQAGWMVVAFLAARAPGPGPRPLRRASLLPRRPPDPAALRPHPRRPRGPRHPRSRQHLPGPARPRPPHAHGRCSSPWASSCSCAWCSPSGCCAWRPFPTSPRSSRPCSRPVTPFFPSFWAGELLFSALQGRIDGLHLGALWTTALGPRGPHAPGLRPALLLGLEQGPGGAQGPLHAASPARRAGSTASPCPPLPASSWSRT